MAARYQEHPVMPEIPWELEHIHATYGDDDQVRIWDTGENAEERWRVDALGPLGMWHPVTGQDGKVTFYKLLEDAEAEAERLAAGN
jgi:hypothetical protein